MRVLIDTHIFIWWDSESSKLSSEIFELLKIHQLVLSVASVWEMQIKLQQGKLELRLSLAEIIQEQQSLNNLEVLPVHVEHVLALQHLPLHHKDPFDRLIIAQALREGLPIISADAIFPQYPVTVLR
jgi:PIN domain nuclease of toxin-antitoxin system